MNYGRLLVFKICLIIVFVMQPEINIDVGMCVIVKC